MSIKLIGVDLDGTLLKDHNIIDDYTLDVLKQARAKGIEIVPITGRPYSGLPRAVREAGLMEYCITSNGAQIIALEDDRKLFSRQTETDKAVEIIELLKGFDCMIEVFCDDYGHIEQHHHEHYKVQYTGTLLEDYIFSSRRVVGDVLDFVKSEQKSCDEIFVICKNSIDRDEIHDAIKGISDIQICRLSDRFLEITSAGTNKGSALKRLCDTLGIKLEDTIAFGDGENDLEFLEVAGIAVAMDNARDEVKSKADIIAPSNEDSGVGRILERFI